MKFLKNINFIELQFKPTKNAWFRIQILFRKLYTSPVMAKIYKTYVYSYIRKINNRFYQ